MKFAGRRVLSLAIGVVLALVLGFSLLVFGTPDLGGGPCSRLRAMATDADKIEYVRAWVKGRTRDPEFMEALRDFSSFDSANPARAKYIDLDWRQLGLDRSASVHFKPQRNAGPSFDATELGSIVISYRRSSVVIGLNDSRDLGLQWSSPQFRSHLEPAGDSVYVYCGENAPYVPGD